MNKDKFKIIEGIYVELAEEQKDEKEKLQNNLDRIKEIDMFLNSMRKDSDLIVFSPRSVENLYADKIKEVENEKSVLEDNNKFYYYKLSKLSKQIEQIKQLLKEINEDENDDIIQLKILDIQEKERQRIARELHDSSVQNLTHLIHMIELSSLYLDQDPIKAKLELENCIKILKSTIDEIRETIFDFRPMTFDDLGLKQCIVNFISNCKLQYKNCIIEYDICELYFDEWKDKDKKEINLIFLNIYRIIQEAINNALKHSNADIININIKIENNNLNINIKDNGKGLSLKNTAMKKEKHFGLTIMKERIGLLHGNISINTDVGKGTEISIKIPLL